MKIILTGGGTGGHIFPLVAIAREIKNIKSDSEIIYLGPKDQFAKKAFEKEDIAIKIIPSGKIRRYFDMGAIFKNIIDMFFNVPHGIIKCLYLLQKIKPDLIVSKGGYGSIPVIIAGKILNIPIYLHESDSIAGITNKITGKFAKKIFVSFPVEKIKNLPKGKLIFAGNPVRESLLNGNAKAAQEFFNLKNTKPILLILGGSQGSKRINTIILENLDYLLEKFEIIHQTGKVDYDRVIRSEKSSYHVYDFLNEQAMANALFCCAFIIGRSGSGSISEISAVGKPSILIPLPEAAQNHQLHNAEIYEQSGACIMIEEKKLTKQALVISIERIMNMANIFSSSAKKFSKLDSARKIAEDVLK